ncbi:MAG TPA: hypothetical protein VK433_12120 [Stellaceae bacterium]|nr:hypothetical protein [Stellaceae bacterium]
MRALVLLSLLALLAACESRPLTPQEAADQHRFETGCLSADAQGYEGNEPYCGHNGGQSGGARSR